MDWVKALFGLFLFIQVIGIGAYIAHIGRPREPITPATAGCMMLFQIPFFIVMLLVFQRL